MSSTSTSLRATAWTALLLAGWITACGDPFELERVVGSYALETVVDAPLPTAIIEREDFVLIVHADTLEFFSAGRGTNIQVVGEEEGESADGLNRIESGFSYAKHGGKIAISFDCPFNASCIAPPHLILRPVADGLRATFSAVGKFPLEYRRVGTE